MTPEEQRAVDRAEREATSNVDDPDAYWAAVNALYEMGSREVFEHVRPWARSPDPRLRQLVPDVLRALRTEPFDPDRPRPLPFHEETLALLGQMLLTESNVDVLGSIGAANCDLSDPRLAVLMLPFQSYPSADLRLAVVHAIMCGSGDAIRQAMIALSADPDDDVRNWATFGLGSVMTDVAEAPIDGDDVREALFARAEDPHPETRAEAVLGLARRHDSRAFDLVTRALGERPIRWDHYLEAAEALGDPRLREQLLALQEDGWTEVQLAAALAACGGPGR